VEGEREGQVLACQQTVPEGLELEGLLGGVVMKRNRDSEGVWVFWELFWQVVQDKGLVEGQVGRRGLKWGTSVHT